MKENSRSSSEDDESSSNTWIQWYWNIPENEFLVEVDEDYIRDSFNLYGLRAKFDNFPKALKMVISITNNIVFRF